MNQQPQQQANEPVICVTQGRIVFTGENGDLFKGHHKKNYKTQQPEFDPKTNQPVWEWLIGLAVPKIAMEQDKLGIGKIWTEMWTAYFKKHPQGQQLIDPKTGFPNPKQVFSMKCKDGDRAYDENGQLIPPKEGWAGHYILTLSTRLPVQFFIPQGGTNVQVTEGIKVGDYVNVVVQLNAGDSGLFLNPKMVQLVQSGKAIVAGPSADQMFGLQQPTMSQFIKPVVDPMSNPATAFGNMTVPQPQTPVYQQPVQPQAPVQAAPNYGALPPHFQPQVPAAPQAFDPNALNAGQPMPVAPFAVGGNPTQAAVPNVNQNPYPTNGMPRQ